MKEYKFSQPSSDGTTIDVTHVTATEQVYEDPANSSIASTVRTLNKEEYVELVESDSEEEETDNQGNIPRFTECTRERDVSMEKHTEPFACDLCSSSTDHGGCKA